MFKIRITNLNKARWAFPNQSFMSNIVGFDIKNIFLLEEKEIPYKIGHYDIGRMWHDADVMSLSQFKTQVSAEGYGLQKNGDLISFKRTGDKCFAAQLSTEFNQYVSWETAYLMYVDFQRSM